MKLKTFKEETIMLEKQKKWCQEKVEKGKKWVEERKFEIGVSVGAVIACGSIMLASKLSEPEKRECQVYYGDLSKDGFCDFAIGLVDIDRFGRRHEYEEKTIFLNESSKDRLFDMIEQAIKVTKQKRSEI